MPLKGAKAAAQEKVLFHTKNLLEKIISFASVAFQRDKCGNGQKIIEKEVDGDIRGDGQFCKVKLR